jgi:predicted CxxxxCH...CXXCH cytochrome family protein
MAKEDDAMKTTLLRRTVAALTIAGTALLFGACSELKSDLPAPGAEKGVHEVGWNDPTTTAFHGKVLKAGSYDFDACVTCHAKALNGGTSKTSCYTCHTSYPHKIGWTDTSATQFHGKFLRLGMGTLTDCATCHGANFSGGTSGKSCFTCHGSYPHKTGWTGNVPATSHGGYLQGKNWNLTECAGCHGSDFKGGSSGKSCFTCHSSYPHSAFTGAGGHAAWLYTAGYPLAQCKTCHGATYDGGAVVSKSCMSSGCHVDAGGVKKTPEACNTCHGQFRALASDIPTAAPPKSVLGDSLASQHSVGAHQRHLVSGALGRDVKCVECHTVPASAFASGHIDTQLPAEVVFNDTLAKLTTANGTYRPVPAYINTTYKCNNTYCHGNWKAVKSNAPTDYLFAYADSVIEGANYSPVWSGGTAEAACGTCHGLPPKGHMAATLQICANCHTGVVNGSGVIIDKTKHINGKIDVFGIQRNF